MDSLEVLESPLRRPNLLNFEFGCFVNNQFIIGAILRRGIIVPIISSFQLLLNTSHANCKKNIFFPYYLLVEKQRKKMVVSSRKKLCQMRYN